RSSSPSASGWRPCWAASRLACSSSGARWTASGGARHFRRCPSFPASPPRFPAKAPSCAPSQLPGRSRLSSSAFCSRYAPWDARSSRYNRGLLSPTPHHLLAHERVHLLLDADARFVHMPRQDDRLIRQHQQLVDDAAHLLLVVAAGQVRPPNRAGEERVAAEQQALG